MSAHTRIASNLRNLIYNTKGSASVEFVLWMPLFVLFTMLIFDVSVLFTSQSNYWSVSRDTARLVSRHAMDKAAAEAYASERSSILWSSPKADVKISRSTVTVRLSAPANQVLIFNTLALAGLVSVDASFTQSMEPS